MRRPQVAPVGVVCSSLAVAAASACSASGSQSSADCAEQVRTDSVVYTSHGVTERQPRRHASAERAECEDVGKDAAGSVFPDDPTRVATWAFDGYPPAAVLGVRYGNGSFGVFIADSLSVEERERIHEDLVGGRGLRPS